MSNVSKPRVVKDYEALDNSIQEQVKLQYPYGFDRYLVTFKNKDGKFVSALPFETEDRYYLIRMTRAEAQNIILEDDSYDDDGILKDDIKLELSGKYDDNIDEVDIAGEIDLDLDDDDTDDDLDKDIPGNDEDEEDDDDDDDDLDK